MKLRLLEIESNNRKRKAGSFSLCSELCALSNPLPARTFPLKKEVCMQR